MGACMCAQGILGLLHGVWLCSTSPFKCSVISWSFPELVPDACSLLHPKMHEAIQDHMREAIQDARVS